MRNCFISESGVIVRGVVNVTAAEKLFYACSETKEESLSAGWSKVLSDSIKNCESSFPIKRGIRDEDYVYFYNKFIECVRMLNFVNCDKPVGGNDKCPLMMEKMKKSCNASNYEFLHGFFYEVSFYRSPLEIKNWLDFEGQQMMWEHDNHCVISHFCVIKIPKNKIIQGNSLIFFNFYWKS